MTNNKLVKTILDLIKTNSYMFLVFILILIISVSVSVYKSSLFNKLQDSELIVKPIMSFDKKTIKFISEHNFSDENISFHKFVKNLAEHNFAIITDISRYNKSRIDNFQKTKYKIRGYFWHDKFAFKFIEELQNYHPGFLKLLDIDIDKFSKVNEFKPFIKLEILCEIFQKF